MRIESYKIQIPSECRVLEIAEESCRCGSCETEIVKIYDDEDSNIDRIEYNTKKEGQWVGIANESTDETLRTLAKVIFQLAKIIRKNDIQTKDKNDNQLHVN